MDEKPGATESITVSTHVLDGSAGGGIAGIRVVITTGAGDSIASGITDSAGRIAELVAGLDPGTYAISWRTNGAFLKSVTATVELTSNHFHVPVIASGTSAVVYLGA